VLVGRVLEVKGLIGKAEFTQDARIGDYIYYRLPGDKKVMCQITSLKTAPTKGYHGDFKIMTVDSEMPRPYADLYILLKPLNTGHLEIGASFRNQPVKLRVNPFFLHVLVAGMTQMGKTHVLIVLCEEFLKQRVPCLVIDAQGELSHLNEFSPDAIVTEELKFEDFIGYLKQRKTVVYNLQGLSYRVKAKRAYEVLSELMSVKEKDYKHAENDARLLEHLPVLVVVDEAEIYAPEWDKSTADPECKATLIEIAKRGSKYGIGLILATQRPPQLELELRSQCNSAMIFHVYDDGSRKVLRMLPYLSSLELNRVKNFTRGQCLLAGQLVTLGLNQGCPMMVNVRDIQTKRAKNVNFEEMLGLKKLPAEVEEKIVAETSPVPSIASTGKAEIRQVIQGASIEVSALCPDCHKPLVYRKGKLTCSNDKCKVLEVRGGKVIRAALPARS